MVGLPTGSTPMKMYENLVKYHKANKISFKYVKTFNMDEYASKFREKRSAPDGPNSNAS